MKILDKLARLIVGEPTPTESPSKDEPKEQNRQTSGRDRPARRENPRAHEEGPKKHRKRNNRNKKKKAAGNQRAATEGHRQEQGQKPEDKKRRPAPVKVDPRGFKDLGLREEILRAVGQQGYTDPTPIQKAAIADIVAGRDLLGCAQTGTGKTAAFALPTLQLLSNQPSSAKRKIRVLVLTPTRELALQVMESYEDYGRYLPHKSAVIFGGVGAEPQKKQLRAGVDVLVATPGRLLDLFEQRCLDFEGVEILVLDEADRMLDLGFLPQVKRIVKLLPKRRQNILFSATMPNDIADLAMNILHNPVKVEVAPVSSASERVEQTVYHVNRNNKPKLLLHVLEDPSTYKVLVFTRTKAIANRVTSHLLKHKISAEAIHGNKSQSARQRALDNFKGEKTRVLIASDLAARGIDVDDITHVINYDVPNIAETYVHRIGRTGRAMAEGKATSFADSEEQIFIRGIEKLIGKTIPIVTDHPFPFEEGEILPKQGGNRHQRNRGRPASSRGRPNSSNRGRGRSKGSGRNSGK